MIRLYQLLMIILNKHCPVQYQIQVKRNRHKIHIEHLKSNHLSHYGDLLVLNSYNRNEKLFS